jgi:D-cysteine desulfhydrase
MEKINLLKLPTALHEIEVDNKNRYFIKRDDLTDFVLGGNKARKLEYFLYDIQGKGCNYIVTYGSAQSNHCRIVVAAAARLGLKCLLILAGSENDFTFAGNDIIYFLTGANIRWCNVNEVRSTIDREMKNLKRQGYNPYFIPGGGHGNCGTHAYVEAYKEIEQQSKEMGINFDYIFLASGTGTTQAGLIAGKKVSNGTEEIVGISIARRAYRGIEVIRESLKSYYMEFYNENLFNNKDIIFDDSYIGEGYADIYIGIAETIKFMLCKNSIILDPVYTGKAFYGMCQYINKNDIEGKNILFIHTGGTPIFFGNGRKIVDLLN